MSSERGPSAHNDFPGLPFKVNKYEEKRTEKNKRKARRKIFMICPSSSPSAKG